MDATLAIVIILFIITIAASVASAWLAHLNGRYPDRSKLWSVTEYEKATRWSGPLGWWRA